MRQEPKLIPQTLNGDLRRGGWILTGYAESDTDAVKYGDNWILRAKSGSLSYDPDWREIFNGHILEEPDQMQIDRYSSRVVVRAGTIDNLLKGDLQAIGFTEQASPANDHQITGLQLGDIVLHILDSHTNVIYNATTMPDGIITDTSNIDVTNSIALPRYNVDKSSNLWQTLQGIGGGEKAGEFYTIFVNRQNKIYYQPTPNFWTTPPTSKGTLTKEHIRALRIKRNANRPGEKIGQVSITAIKDHSTVYTSTRPVNQADGKRLGPLDGIYADSQAKTNTLAQRLYDWLNRSYTLQVDVDPGLVLFGDSGGLDLSDKIAVTFDGPTEDTATGAGLHINFSAQSFFVYGINIRFDSFGKMATATLTLEQDPT